MFFGDFVIFLKKNGVLAARLVAMTFTLALGYAKHPLLPAADIAGSPQRIICTVNTVYIPHR